MLEKSHNLGSGAAWWLLVIILVLSMEGVALFYQYGLRYDPCVLCIHVRIWLVAWLLVAIPVLIFRRYRPVLLLGHLSTAVIGAGLLERSWLLLGTERGFLDGVDCGFGLGMPSWLALDEWFPWLFQVQTSCGYTPELPLGITMAEALLVFSVVVLVAGAWMTLAAMVSFNRTGQQP